MQGRKGRNQALDDELHRQGGHDQAHDPGGRRFLMMNIEIRLVTRNTL